MFCCMFATREAALGIRERERFGCKFAANGSGTRAINETLHSADLAQTWSTPSAPPPVTRAFLFEEAPLGPKSTAPAGRTPLSDMI